MSCRAILVAAAALGLGEFGQRVDRGTFVGMLVEADVVFCADAAPLGSLHDSKLHASAKTPGKWRMMASFGLGAAWLERLASLAAPHRLVLLAVAVCLFGAVVFLWRRGRTMTRSPGGICTDFAFCGAAIIGVLVGLALLYLGDTYA